MKNTLTLSFSIFKGNKGFSIGLLLLFFFGATLIVMSSIIPPTISTSLYNFIDDYNMSQATIVTDPMKVEVEGFDTSIDGINNIESQMVVDTTVKVSDDLIKQMRLYTVEDDGFRKYYFYEKKDVADDEKTIWITLYFSEAFNLHAGDYIDIKFPNGYESIKIAAVVSNPESSSCCYDDTFYCEDYDFGNVFMPRSDFDDLYKISNLCNMRSFLFDKDLSLEKKDEAIDKACSILGDGVKSSEVFERSKSKQIIDSNIDSLSQACEIFPYMIFIVLVICSYLFLNQTINNQRKKIGLLRALGYSSRKVMNIYIIYVSIISVISIIIGCVAGQVFNNYVIEEYQFIFSMPEITYVIPVKTYVLLGIIFLTGILSCLISARGITKIDPSEAYSSSVVTTKPYQFKTPLLKRMKVFNKISIAKIFKNKRRFLVLSLSISACIILSFMSLACMHSKNASNDALFGKRLNYDLLVYFDGDTIYDEIASMDEVASIEPGIVFTERLYLNDKDMNLQYNAIKENSQLVIPSDINYKRVYSEDGIVLEQYVSDLFDIGIGDEFKVSDVDVRVNEIACEYANYVQYISFETAKKLGHDKTNAAFIKLKDNTDEAEVFKLVSDMSGFKYMKFVDHQHFVKLQNQKALDLVYYAIIFISIFIGLIIIVNMVAIAVHERKFEYGTLLALGTDTSKFVYMVIVENLLQYIVASIIAFVPCYFFAELILHSLSSQQQNFPFVDITNIYIEAFCLALIYIIVGVIYTLVRIKRINPATTLNIRE